MVWPVAAIVLLLLLLLLPEAGYPRLIAGVLLVHLFPGLAVVRLLDRRADIFEQLALGLALSPAVVTIVLYCSTYILRLPFGPALAVTGVLLAGLLLFTSLRREQSLVPSPTLPAGAVFSVAILLTGMLTLYFVKQPASMIGPHGLFHTATVHQVMNGIIPPHNTHLLGAPTAYQWPCYLFTAAAARFTGANPPMTAAFLRLASFTGVFGMGYLMARRLGQGVAGRALSGLFTALGMNLLGGLHVLYATLVSFELRTALFSGRHHLRQFVVFTPWFISEELSLRLTSLIIKLFHFSFILPGYLAVMVAIFGLLLAVKGEGRKGYALLGLGTFGALLIHPLLAISLAVPLPLAYLALRFTGGRAGQAPDWKQALAVFGSLLLPALASLPYLVPEMRTSGGHGVNTGFALDILLACGWIYAPLLISAGWGALKRSKPLEQTTWLLWLFALFNVVFLTLQQIKCEWYMLYVTAIPLGLLAGDALGRLYDRSPWPRLRWAWFGPLLLLALSGPLLWLHFNSLVNQGRAPRYLVSNQTMLRLQNGQSDLARAYDWIRDNTKPTDILVELPREHSREELAALTGRRVYVGQPSVHTPPADDPRMMNALAVAGALFDPQADKQESLAQLADLPFPVYLLVDHRSLRQDFDPLVRIFAATPNITLVLDTPKAKIYRLI